MLYIISGVAFTGNQGAAAMATAIIQNLTESDPEHRFYVYTYYPGEDAGVELPENVRLLSATPATVVCNGLLTLWAFFCIALRFPKGFYRKSKFISAVLDSDYWLDASGISFADGREKPLIYNVMSIVPPLLLKCPVVKMPQALGPFNNRINRWAAKWILPRIKLICARGKQSSAHLESLGLDNIAIYPDLAFSLQTSDSDRQAAQKYILSSEKKVIGISPSQVVYQLCRKQKIPYLDILKQTIEELLHSDYHVVVFAHSARKGINKRHNNDLPLLHEFSRILTPSPHLQLVTEEYTASQLRELIRSFDVMLASRFHALISAICTATPTVTLGWGHKYAEVLDEFGYEAYSINYAEMSPEKLLHLVERAQANREQIKKQIQQTLPQTKKPLEELYRQLSHAADKTLGAESLSIYNTPE